MTESERMKMAQRPTLLEAFQDGDLGNDVAAEMELDLEFYPAFEYGWACYWGLREEAWDRLHAFAQDGTGGLVCLWQHEPGLELERAPVVLCGSEGELEVLGMDLADYLVQVVWGYDHFGAGPAAMPHDEGARVLVECGVVLPDDPTGLRPAAQAAYPGFEAWIQANLSA